jgi:tRNA(adenine34) deaminase
LHDPAATGDNLDWFSRKAKQKRRENGFSRANLISERGFCRTIIGMTSDLEAMREAVAEARKAAGAGEVPIGAVMVCRGEIIARGQNSVIRTSDPTAHAEIGVLRQAARTFGNYRLLGCTLYVTLEPCAMCAGALIHARVERLVYGAADAKAGACGSVLSVINHPQLNHQMVVQEGVLAEPCGELLRMFFRERR